MLTRHWIFVDAKGNLNAEVKGPGEVNRAKTDFASNVDLNRTRTGP